MKNWGKPLVGMLTLLLLAQGQSAHAITEKKSLDKTWNEVMKDFNLTPKYHGFCYIDEDGKIKGPNPHRRIRLASTTKLITTLIAVDALGPDFEYETKIHFDGKSIHIEGSQDPIISKRKLFYIISQLNRLGIKEVENITFNKNFPVFSHVERIHLSEFKPNTTYTQKTLTDYFTVDEWNKLKIAYNSFIQTTPKKLIEEFGLHENVDEISFRFNAITSSEENPLEKSAMKTYILKAPSIQKYLKHMNVVSNNYIADVVFNKLGGQRAYHKYLQDFLSANFKDYTKIREEFESNEHSLYMYTGSGLNMGRGEARRDNYASCALVVSLVKELDVKLNKLNKHIQDFVAVPGVDGGTFKRRLNTPRIAKSLVAKTGTLMHTSALTGRVSTQKGNVYFGMFHQLKGWKGNAKAVQNLMVDKMLDYYEGPKKFEYNKHSFFPAKGKISLVEEIEENDLIE